MVRIEIFCIHKRTDSTKKLELQAVGMETITLLGSFICLSYEFLAFTQNAPLWNRPMLTLLKNDRTITDEFASGSRDKATVKFCILYKSTECLLQHAAKLSCHFVLGREQLSGLASDQMVF